MNHEKTPQEVEQLRQHVQELLDTYVRQEKFDFRLIVTEEYVQQEDWLHILVLPDRKGIRAYEYAEALSAVSRKLHREEHVENVLLLPALAA